VPDEKGLITQAEFMVKLSAERTDTSSSEFHRYPKAFGKLSEFSHDPTFSPLYFKERFFLIRAPAVRGFFSSINLSFYPSSPVHLSGDPLKGRQVDFP